MSNDNFLEKLREDAKEIRYQPQDDSLWTRLPARIRERIRLQPSVAQLLTRWFRPITLSFAALALAAALSVTWFERTHEPAYTLEAMGPNSMEITVDGDTFSLAE